MNDWHTSTYSGNTGACVEVKEDRVTSVRDTQNRESGHLTFRAQEWSALVNTVRASG
ncbi:DUF397 domain-containing protein [Nocardiopsis aegyptia]|uniref:DUF397 domain-containing protein n=1 Tax=Nocardiopsis aegyptia TaxID=220378 RepID=UPI003671E170